MIPDLFIHFLNLLISLYIYLYFFLYSLIHLCLSEFCKLDKLWISNPIYLFILNWFYINLSVILIVIFLCFVCVCVCVWCVFVSFCVYVCGSFYWSLLVCKSCLWFLFQLHFLSFFASVSETVTVICLLYLPPKFLQKWRRFAGNSFFWWSNLF